MSNTNCTLLSQKQLDKLRQDMKNPVFKYLSKGYLQAIVNAIKTSSGTNVDPTAAEVEKMINTSIQENQEQSLNILRDYYKREKQFADRIANMRANGHIEERGSDATNDYLESVTTVQHLRLLDKAFKVIPMREFITSLPTKDGKKYFSTKVGVLLIDIFGNPVIVNDPNVSEKTIRQQEEAFKAILPSRTVKFATFSNFSDNKEIQWKDSPEDEVPSVEDINSADAYKEETGIDVDDINAALESNKGNTPEVNQQDASVNNVKIPEVSIPTDVSTLKGERKANQAMQTLKAAKEGVIIPDAVSSEDNADTPIVLNPIDIEAIQSESRRNEIKRAFTPAIRNEVTTNLAELISNLLFQNIESYKSELQKQQESYRQQNGNDDPSIALMLEDLEDRETCVKTFIESKGIEDILNQARQYLNTKRNACIEFSTKKPENKDAYLQRADLLGNVDKYLEDLLEDASIQLEQMTGLRISVSNQDGVIKTAVNENTATADIDTANQDDNEKGDPNKSEASESIEGLKYRYIDPFALMSREVKMILSSIDMADANIGKDNNWEVDHFVKGILGVERKMPVTQTYAIMLDAFTKYVTKPDDFYYKDEKGEYHFPLLDILKEQHYWARFLENKLRNAVNEDNLEILSKFYTAMRMDFIGYDGIKHDPEKGYQNIKLNQKERASGLLKDAMVSTVNGVRLSVSDVYSYDAETCINNAKKALEINENLFANLRAVSYGEDNSDTRNRAEALVIPLKNAFGKVGLNLSPVLIRSMVISTIGTENNNTPIVRALTKANDIVKRVSQGKSLNKEDKANNKGKISDFRNIVNNQPQDYKWLCREFSEVSSLNNESSFKSADGSKSYQSYSTPNFVGELVNTFTNLDKWVRLANSKSDDYFVGKLFYEIKYENDSERGVAKTVSKNNKLSIEHKVDILIREYLMDKYGNKEWFYKDNEWRNPVLEMFYYNGYKLMSNSNFMNKRELVEIDSTDYNDWTSDQITSSMIERYCGDAETIHEIIRQDMTVVDNFSMTSFNFPILADSPVCMLSTQEQVCTQYDVNNPDPEVLKRFRNIVKQEIDRIKLVKARKALKAEPITNFDDKGSEFCFFPQLNKLNFFDNYQAMEKTATDKEKNAFIDNVMKDVIAELVAEDRYDASIIKDMTEFKTDEEAHLAMNAMAVNGILARANIIQLTTTDLAFYKNWTDFQKRFKEVYAHGKKLDTNSRFGRKTERTIYLSDRNVVSRQYARIKSIFDHAVKTGKMKSYDRDNFLHKFKEINATDAQSYRSLSSMRAVLDMVGNWNIKMQKAFERFSREEYSIQDMDVVWNTIKPYMYTVVDTNDGVNNGTIAVPHQNKNSEFLLLTMLNVLNSSAKSPMMKSLNAFMEKNQIDVVTFESAVKAGCQGTIDISHNPKKFESWINANPDTWKTMLKALSAEMKDAKKFNELSNWDKFCEASFIQLDKGSISQDEYNERMVAMELTEEEMTDILNDAVFTKDSEGNSTFDPNVVHELPYDNYCIQQPTPEHLFDHEVIFGSQFRNLILSDIPNDTEITFKGKKTTMGDLKKLYMNCINANLKESFDEVKKMFQTGPKGMIKLQQKLLSQIKGNPKYGREIEAALELIKDENGNIDFAIPLDNPNTTVALQELLLSVFKNQITKQYIKGATCVLASNIGYTKELNIVYEGDPKNERIKYIECYMPAYSKRFYEPFLKKNSDGSIELDYSKMPEELKMGIGYRIPTESKYSMVPLYIKGFLPQQNGSAIMLPEEITTMAGSDFDIDKLFMMLTEFMARNTYDKKKAWSDFYNANPELNKLINKAQWNSYKESLNQLKETNPEAAEEYDFTKEFKDWFVKSSGLKKHEWVEGTLNKFTEWFKQNKDNYIISTEFKKVEYNSSKTPEQNTREARNNLILDISHAILTHEEVAPLVLRAGNFDGVKEVARIKTILDNYELLTEFAKNRGKSLTEDEIASLEAKHLKSEYASPEDEAEAKTNLEKAKAEMLATKMLPVFQDILNKHDLKTVDDFLKKSQKQNNPLTLKGFIQNHQQNTAGGKMIGIYANNTTQQAKYQNTGLCLKDDYVFTFNGREIKQLDQIKNVYGEYISHNCAQFSASSVDNAKDPVLQYLLQTTDTANITGFLLRAGFSIEEVFLIFTHPVFQSMYYNGKLNRGAVNAELTKRNKARGLNGVDISDRDFTTDELLKDILLASFHGDTQDYDYQTREIAFLGLLSKILAGAEAINQLTMTSRADSPNGATKPRISMLENQLSRVDQLNYALNDSDFALTGLEHPVSNNTNENYINDSETPMLQGFQTYGLSYIPQVLDTYFLQFAPEVRSRVSEILEQAPRANRDRLLQDFYQQAVEFALTETNMFGTTDSNTFEEKRDYYIYDFPADFLKVVSETPELENSDLLKVLLVKEGVIKFTGNASNEVLLEYLRDQLEEMLYSDNAVVRKLATDLFMYSFYKEGLNYNSTSIGKLFSTSFLTSIPEYIKTVRDAKNKVRDSEFMNKFMAQFYANNFKDACVDFSKVNFKEDNAGNIRIPIKLAVNVNTKGKKDSVSDYYDRMRVGDTMYMLIGVDDKGAIYTSVITFNEKTTGEIKSTLYNAKATVHQIFEHKIDEKAIKRNKNTGIQNNEEFGYLDSINEDSLDGLVDPSEEYYEKTSNGVNNFSQEEGFKKLPLTGEQAELLKNMC